MRKLLLGLVILAVVVGLALAGRYDYTNQGGQALRIDRFTGRTAVLRKAANGGVAWTNIATPEDVSARQPSPGPPLVLSPIPAVSDCPDQGPYSASGRPELFKPQCDKDGNRVSTFQ